MVQKAERGKERIKKKTSVAEAISAAAIWFYFKVKTACAQNRQWIIYYAHPKKLQFTLS